MRCRIANANSKIPVEGKAGAKQSIPQTSLEIMIQIKPSADIEAHTKIQI
jgi:hypothetical protein